MKINGIKFGFGCFLASNFLLTIANAQLMPSTPVLSIPNDQQTGVQSSSVTFKWSSAVAGVMYRFVVSQDSGFGGYNDVSGTCDSSCGVVTTSSVSHTRTLSLYGKKYYWKVYAYNSKGKSNWSSVRSFVTKPSLLSLPFASNKTWYICQGYNGTISHKIKSSTATSLDLGTSLSAVGKNGCVGSATAAQGQSVVAPDSGSVVWVAGMAKDIMCLALDSGGSMKIGHLSTKLAAKSKFSRDQYLGTLNAPSIANGDYSHIHMQFFSDKECKNAGVFGNAFGYPNLLDDGTTNKWSGIALNK